MEKRQPYVKVKDGWGWSDWIPKKKLPYMEKIYEEHRMLCMEAGHPEWVPLYTLQIIEEKD